VPTAYSYIRFSHPSQAEGDSLRRQTEAARAYCLRRGWTLDESLIRPDLGVSAFRGRNALVGNLGAFLQAIKDGVVKPGSVLIVESVDRISRQGIDEGYDLCKRILKAGVRLVTLAPERDFGLEAVKKLTAGALELMLILERAAEESEMKAGRLGAAWVDKRAETRETRSVLTARVPAWLEVVGRRLEGKHMVGGSCRPIQERVDVVKRIFSLACSGYGLALIVRELTNAKVATWGGGAGWSKMYVRSILTSRAVLGEYQPRTRGKPDGPPVPNYYPAVVDEATWLKAQEALASRKGKGGRLPGEAGGKTLPLLGGLVRDALTGQRLLVSWQGRSSGKNRRKIRVLVPAGSMQGRERSRSFPYQLFEDGLLGQLAEIKPAELFANKPEGESAAIDAELAAVANRLRQIKTEMTGGLAGVAVLAQAAQELEEKQRSLTKQLRQAQQREANPCRPAWDEAMTLLDVAKDEATRLRLRGLLRTAVRDIQALIVPHGVQALAVVQVNFTEGARRSYMLYYRAAGYCRPSRRLVQSWVQRPDDGIGLSVGVDLRDPAEAAKMAKAIAAWPQSEWDDYAAAAETLDAAETGTGQARATG
jgi:DNA invertase Pin-like site-specific DNA recombinase